ncbi:replicative DNA helicase [Patescibacteria group bacterium]|nr:replicative DNA helicase [Patescibacteria group bacterium]MBU2263365.1 replicative DNA helicase [Patescibacteria group bacterium]
MEKEISKSNIRIPPHDLEVEKSVLGALMLDANAMNIVVDIIKPEDFYDHKHTAIYEAMLELYEKREPIDILSVSSRLKEKKLTKQAGGSAYLTELANSVATSANVKHYAELVRKKKILRDLIESSSHISHLGYNEEEDIELVLDEAERKIFSIARYSIKQKFQSVKSALAEAWERIDRLHKSSDEIRGIATGFSGLDNLLAGLQKSDLIILAARPSMGKTALALDIARNVAKKGKAVGVFSLEMSSQQLVDRLLAAEAKVDSWKLRTGRLSRDEDFAKISMALDTLSRSPIFIDDEPSKNILQMRAMARRLQSEQAEQGGLGLIIVDYIQLITPRQKVENAVQQMTEVSRSLKALAKELDVPVLAISQLSRAVESRHDKRPKLHDLRDSGSIEQDADVVMFIYREDRYRNSDDEANLNIALSEAEILIEKHRNGPIGKVRLHFHPQKITFTSIEKGDFGQL